jgi:hypothetical protein
MLIAELRLQRSTFAQRLDKPLALITYYSDPEGIQKGRPLCSPERKGKLKWNEVRVTPFENGIRLFLDAKLFVRSESVPA